MTMRPIAIATNYCALTILNRLVRPVANNSKAVLPQFVYICMLQGNQGSTAHANDKTPHNRKDCCSISSLLLYRYSSARKSALRFRETRIFITAESSYIGVTKHRTKPIYHRKEEGREKIFSSTCSRFVKIQTFL